jgi:septum formation protein
MLILASKSPRRSQILRDAGFEFTVKHYDVDESFPTDIYKGDVAEFLSRKKAEAYPEDLHDDLLVCADTIVCVDDKILNKPADFAEARAMLEILSGRMHEVFTGVTLRNKNGYHTFTERTDVYFTMLEDSMITGYIEKYRPYDKAGAYGIQEGIGYTGIEKISGCYYNVMGMPVSRLYKELKIFVPEMISVIK